MTTLTRTTKRGEVQIFSFEDSPHSAAEAALTEGTPAFYIVFDLQREREPLSTQQVADWIARFRRSYYERLDTATHVSSLLPTMLVFSDRFDMEQAVALRQLGAVLFDRSVSSNADCQTFEGWLRRNPRSQPVTTNVTPGHLEGVIKQPLEVLNSDPVGISQAAVEEHLRCLNDT